MRISLKKEKKEKIIEKIKCANFVPKDGCEGLFQITEKYAHVCDNYIEKDVDIFDRCQKGEKVEIRRGQYYIFDKMSSFEINSYKIIGEEIASPPTPWRWDKKNNNCTMMCGNLLVISEKEAYHKFPIKGKYIKTQKKQNLFFCDEKNGKHILTEKRSRKRSRFASDEEINTVTMKEGAIYSSLFKDSHYIVREV